jgi:hypothetical protein
LRLKESRKLERDQLVEVVRVRSLSLAVAIVCDSRLPVGEMGLEGRVREVGDGGGERGGGGGIRSRPSIVAGRGRDVLSSTVWWIACGEIPCPQAQRCGAGSGKREDDVRRTCLGTRTHLLS